LTPKPDEIVKSQQNDGFDVGASCGRPCPGERSSPLSRVSRDNDEVEAQSRSERDRWTFYETIKPLSHKIPYVKTKYRRNETTEAPEKIGGKGGKILSFDFSSFFAF